MNVRQVLPRDAIPSVDDPSFVDDYVGDPDDEVVVLQVGEETRAYPVRILDYHEIGNDVVDGEPVAVTWCPLCGSAIAYHRRVDGRVLTFGVSGKLADDDLVMYDRETGSEWKQTLGEAIAGPLEGTELALLPAPLVPYRRYQQVHGGPVLARPGGESEAAGPGDGRLRGRRRRRLRRRRGLRPWRPPRRPVPRVGPGRPGTPPRGRARTADSSSVSQPGGCTRSPGRTTTDPVPSTGRPRRPPGRRREPRGATSARAPVRKGDTFGLGRQILVRVSSSAGIYWPGPPTRRP